jgi:NADPH:quinone reductase
LIVTAGSDEKCAACTALGADLAVNYKTQDFVAVVREWLGANHSGRAVDVVLDMVGGEYLQREIDLLAEDGRLVVIATQGGSKAEIDASLLMRKRITLTGSTLRPRSLAFKTSLAQALREKVWPLYETGKCLPQIHSVFAPDQAVEAHRLMESSQHVGKIMLDWKLQ